MLRIVLAAAAFCVLTPSLALAQLYTWKDASGRMIISDTPKDPSAKTIAYVGNYGVSTKAVSRSFRPTAYDDLIAEHASRHALHPDFVRAVIQAESAFNPYARSPKGAMGLMQLMPSTAAEYRVRNAYDPAENIRGGTVYLRQLLDKFGSEQLALAAYNAGPGAVDKYDGVPPYRETKEYVRKVGSKATLQDRAEKRTVIYRWIEVIGDRAVPKFSQDPPRSGSYEIVN